MAYEPSVHDIPDEPAGRTRRSAGAPGVGAVELTLFHVDGDDEANPAIAPEGRAVGTEPPISTSSRGLPRRVDVEQRIRTSEWMGRLVRPGRVHRETIEVPWQDREVEIVATFTAGVTPDRSDDVGAGGGHARDSSATSLDPAVDNGSSERSAGPDPVSPSAAPERVIGPGPAGAADHHGPATPAELAEAAASRLRGAATRRSPAAVRLGRRLVTAVLVVGVLAGAAYGAVAFGPRLLGRPAIVAAVAGNGDRELGPFTVEGPWGFEWSTAGPGAFEVSLVDATGAVAFVARSAEPGSGTAQPAATGAFTVIVAADAETAWRVEVAEHPR